MKNISTVVAGMDNRWVFECCCRLQRPKASEDKGCLVVGYWEAVGCHEIGIIDVKEMFGYGTYGARWFA